MCTCKEEDGMNERAANAAGLWQWMDMDMDMELQGWSTNGKRDSVLLFPLQTPP